MTKTETKAQMAIQLSLLRLLCEHPIDKISVRDIADDAQVSRTTFYHYYPNVYELHDRVVQQIGKDFQALLTTAEDSETAPRMANSVNAVVDYVVTNHGRLRLFFSTNCGRATIERLLKIGVQRWRIQNHVSMSDNQKLAVIVSNVYAIIGILDSWLHDWLKFSQEELRIALQAAIRV